jgi:predicted Zn-dependent peptidase
MAKPTIATTTSSDDEYSQIDAAIESALRPHVAIAKDEARRCTAPERTTIAIVGHVDAKAALAMTRKHFARFAASKLTARTWRSTFSSEKTIKLHGAAAAQVTAWPVPRSATALAMVASSRLAKYGIETELRDEQFRIIGDVTRLDERLRGDTQLERRLVDTQLLQKLESLRYRASVLASGVDVDHLRASIAATDDLGAFAETLASTPSVIVEVAP